MSNYTIEGNINFYDELYKCLDDDSENDEDNICQISGLPLSNNCIQLECNHKFNYDALYTEICKQKYDFKTYRLEFLSKTDVQRFQESGKNYFIKCP